MAPPLSAPALPHGVPLSMAWRRRLASACARMSNTFFAPGSHAPDELLGSLEDGLYICQGSNGMEDPKGWGIQVGAHFAREYRHGRPTGRLFSPVSLTGYVPDVLGAVSMVANGVTITGKRIGDSDANKEFTLTISR